jgi:signal peptidase I
MPARRNLLREFGGLALMLVAILAGRSSLADHYVVPSGSMEYTLLPGDRVVVDKRAYGLRLPFTRVELASGGEVRRGDVVIFDSPTDGTRLVKRIVAIGGDRVSLEDGHLRINGRPAAAPGVPAIESFDGKAVRLRLDHGGGPDMNTVVPDGQLLALGDHRGNSRDSRYFGLIREDEVYARAIAVYYRRDEGVVWRPL